MSSSAENIWSAFGLLAGGFQRRPGLVGVDVVEAETLGVGDHVGEGEVGGVALASAVLEEVVESDLAVVAGLLERDGAVLQQPNQGGAGDTEQEGVEPARLPGEQDRAVCAHIERRYDRLNPPLAESIISDGRRAGFG
nr:hypothetical protein [Frankia sp. Cr2]